MDDLLVQTLHVWEMHVHVDKARRRVYGQLGGSGGWLPKKKGRFLSFHLEGNTVGHVRAPEWKLWAGTWEGVMEAFGRVSSCVFNVVSC